VCMRAGCIGARQLALPMLALLDPGTPSNGMAMSHIRLALIDPKLPTHAHRAGLTTGRCP
jgi:hypothetical protein